MIGHHLQSRAQLTSGESCLDMIDDAIAPNQAHRLRAAFEALRLACRW